MEHVGAVGELSTGEFADDIHPQEDVQRRCIWVGLAKGGFAQDAISE